MILTMLETIFSATFRMSTPLILAALGALFSKRVGVMALCLEGLVSIGAFAAVVGAYYFNNPYIGVLTAILGGLIFAYLHAVLTIRYHVNHVLSGLGVNLLVKAMIPLLLQVLWDTSTNSPRVTALPSIVISGLKDVPILGAFFHSQSPLTYLAFLLIPIVWFLLYKTVFGMRLRIIGNNPYAASTAGVNVKRYKYIGVLLCGVMGGLAGAYLSISQLDLFVDGMSAERGYIAIVINTFGASNPVGLLAGGLMFGFADATQIILQDTQIPVYFLKIIPYAVTLIALVFSRNKTVDSMFIGKHFEE